MHPDNPYKQWPGTRRYAKQQLEFRNPYFPKESREEKTKRHHTLWRYSGALLLVVIIYSVLFTKLFWLESISVKGASPEHSERITRVLEATLNQKHGWIIPGRNKLFLSSQRLQSAVASEFANEISFETLQVAIKGREVEVSVTERTAQLLWQKPNAELWLLDQSGTVFSQLTLPEGEPLPDLPLVKNIASESSGIGQVALKPKFAQTVLNLHRMIHQRFSEWIIKSYSPTLRECPPDTECQAASEMELSVEIGETTTTDIYFSTELSLEDQINALGLLLTQKINNLESVEYIDLRYLPRAFYK